MVVVSGFALVLGDNVSTDDIIPSRYLYLTDPVELARHVFEDYPGVRGRLVSMGSVVIVAGSGFGYGSSREHAPIALRAAGVRAVVAHSFHRIFYRNSINNGLLVVEADLVGLVGDGDFVEIDLSEGVIRTPSGVVGIGRVPGYVLDLIRVGGLRGLLERIGGLNRG